MGALPSQDKMYPWFLQKVAKGSVINVSSLATDMVLGEMEDDKNMEHFVSKRIKLWTS